MLDLVSFLDSCKGIGPIVAFVKNGIFPIIQIGIPIILIIMGSLDLGKAVLSNDDKEIKGATSKLVKRAIAAVAVFFVVTLVSLLMGMFDNATGIDDASGTDTVSWSKCWNNI